MAGRGSILWLVLLGVNAISAPSLAEITITPSNVQIPELASEDFSFDFAISHLNGFAAQAFQSTIEISITGPGTLTFNSTRSKAVVNESEYWLTGSSMVEAFENPAGRYVFGDFPEDAIARDLAVDDLMARYVFEWDGTPGDYTVNLDLDPAHSFVLSEWWTTEPLGFDPGAYTGNAGSFTVTMPVPEPATLILLAFGGLMFRRRG